VNANEEQIAERLPVWEALSEFFLDTQLQPSDYDRIARMLVASRFTENEIEDILIGEVCPVCRSNAVSPAGEWAGFDRDWLKQRCSQRIGARMKLRAFYHVWNKWMYARKWNRVRTRLSQMRAGT